MSRVRHPRRGSMQFWPRKRSRHNLARVRSWVTDGKARPLAFIGYKVGMTHVQATDNRPKSLTKGEKIAFASTIIDCPPMFVAGVSFYKNSKKLTCILAEKLTKDLAKKIQVPKKAVHKLDEITGFDDLRLLAHSQPKLASIGTKKPKLMEISLGGSINDKLNYAKQCLGKEINISNVLETGNYVDVHGISKGKGFQGTVKRYGVPIRQHKAEKTKRGIATLGSWTPKRVEFSVCQPGKMGYHLRTEYNKQILKIGNDGKEVTAKGGIHKYGEVNGNYVMIRGSVIGPKKRAVVMAVAVRPNPKFVKEAPEIDYISLRN